MAPSEHDIVGFERTSLTFDVGPHVTPTRDVYLRGEGPAVIVMAEVPGITPEVAKLATAIADHGFAVYMPQLFGTPNRGYTTGATLGTLARACVSREFSLLAADASSPIVDWLRALARHAHAERGGPGVGAIGMCLTGNFALGMMLDTKVIAPVLSQPSLPVALGARLSRGLHVSPEGMRGVHERIREDGAKVLGLRFHGDPMCPAARFERLRAELGDAFEGIEIDPKHARRGAPKPAHSVLTVHLVDRPGEPTREALDRTLAFLGERLKPS